MPQFSDPSPCLADYFFEILARTGGTTADDRDSMVNGLPFRENEGPMDKGAFAFVSFPENLEGEKPVNNPFKGLLAFVHRRACYCCYMV
ncbi:hypothetical protein MRX96_031794 [Rhipicephalus microplus]